MRRSGEKAQTGEDGHDDGRNGCRQHADDESHGSDQAVHHTLVFRHQARTGDRRLPVGMQTDGNETSAGQEVGAGEMGVVASAFRRARPADAAYDVPLPGRRSIVLRTAPGTAATATATSIHGRPVRSAAATATVHVVR